MNNKYILYILMFVVKISFLEYFLYYLCIYFLYLGLKSGGQYEVQVLGATQNGLHNIRFSWHFIELPTANLALPKPVLTFSINGQSIKVCIVFFLI